MKNKESRFSKNNYETQLEDLLEKKEYTDEAKSLILNIIYKVESAYNDYKKTKPNVKSKNAIIEDIIDTIEHRCDTIEVLDPKETEGKLYVSRRKKIIKTFPNDNDLLQAIYYIKTPYTKKIENVFEKAVLIALEKGMAINGVEIIRDFNGWSWNNVLENDVEQYYNLLYQNLIILLGEPELENVIKSKDVIESLSTLLRNLYGKTKAEDVVSKFIKTCMLIYMDSSEKNEQEVLEYLNKKQQELNKLSNKSEFISKITKQNNENTKIIGKIDSILTSKTLLNKKYASKKISEKYKEIESYKLYLIKYKNKVLNEIAENRKFMNPFEYVKEKNIIQDEVKKLNDIAVCYNNDGIISSSIFDLQKKVISCFYKKIEVYDLKKELINLIYEIRYYNCLPLEGKKLKDHRILKNEIEKIQIEFVNKLKKNKVVDMFSAYTRVNYFIIKYIFEAKMVNINKITFKYKRIDKGMELEFYDEEILESTEKYELTKDEMQGFLKKENKKIKMFI